MQFVVVFLLLFGVCHPAPHEGLPLLNPGGIGGIFEGPDSETIIIGPDGSEITSEQKGGAIIRDDALGVRPIIVAESEIELAPPAPIITERRILSAGPIISSTGVPILASASPVIASAAPILASPSPPLLTGETYDVQGLDYIDAPLPSPVAVSATPIVRAEASIDLKPIEIVEQDPHIIETEIIKAPDVEPQQSSDLKGPSGRIITRGSASIVSGPASTTITEPRKIIVAPPRIVLETPIEAASSIQLQEAPLSAALPVLTGPSLAPLSVLSVAAASTDGSQELSYSTTAAPVDLGYSTSAGPLVGLSRNDIDSSRINLGLGNPRESIPVVEYGSSNGVINGQTLAALGVISSTEAPIISSTYSALETDGYAPSESSAIPAGYLLPPAEPTNLGPTAAGLVSSTDSPYIQRIERIEDNLAVDGRVDMGYSLYGKPKPRTYQLPQVLGLALSSFYHKNSSEEKDNVGIDDKMGDLSQNEVISYDSRSSALSPPDLSQARYIAPSLERNGIDASQVNLASVPLSQVTRLADDRYQSGINRGYLSNRYERNTDTSN